MVRFPFLGSCSCWTGGGSSLRRILHMHEAGRTTLVLSRTSRPSNSVKASLLYSFKGSRLAISPEPGHIGRKCSS